MNLQTQDGTAQGRTAGLSNGGTHWLPSGPIEDSYHATVSGHARVSGHPCLRRQRGTLLARRGHHSYRGVLAVRANDLRFCCGACGSSCASGSRIYSRGCRRAHAPPAASAGVRWLSDSEAGLMTTPGPRYAGVLLYQERHGGRTTTGPVLGRQGQGDPESVPPGLADPDCPSHRRARLQLRWHRR